MLFFGIFYYELGRNSSERFFLFSLFLGLSQLILAGKVSKMVVFSFFNFFCYFLEFSIMSLVGTHRNDFFLFLFFFPLFPGLRQLILAWKEATMVFFNFFEFFCYFFWIFYYGLGRKSMEQFFLFFFFLSFSAFPNLFWLGKMQQWCFLIFLNFLLFFLNFLLRVGLELIGTIFFFSLTQHFQTYFLSFSAFPNIFCLEKQP